jgi:long-subunit fatty acid transport protein
MRKGPYERQTKQFSGKKTLVLTIIACVSFARGAGAQLPLPRIRFAPEPVGSGARALGQSAFIAVADDATAASWNPAGLINLERPEASLVGAWRTITNVYSPTDPGLSTDRDNWSESQINFMSYAHPAEVGNTDVVLSVNYHQVYDFGREFYLTRQPMEEGLDWAERNSSDGAVSAYSLAGGLSMPDCPEITVGASFNWYTQSFRNNYAWQVRTTWWYWDVPGPPSPFQVIKSTDTFDDFRGHNFTFGLLWDVYEKQENLLTFGLVYHTPFTAKLNRELVGIYEFPNDSPGDPMPVSYPLERVDVEYPASLGAGVNYRFSDSLSAAFDVEWKEWSKFEKKDRDTREQSSPIESDTLAYRIGAEHLTFLTGATESVLACRGGAFYEPRPAANDPDPLPVYGLSAGLGWTLRQKFSLDFAYQHRWGEQGLGNIDYKIREHLFISSVIVYF